MADKILDKLAEHGVTGLLLALALWVIYKLYGALEKSRKGRADEVEAVQTARIEDQKARIQDHEKHQAQMLELVRQCVAAITSAVNAQEGSKESLGEVRDSFDKFTIEIRSIFEKLAEEIRKNRR